MPATNSNVILDPVDVSAAPFSLTVNAETAVTDPLSAFGEVLTVAFALRVRGEFGGIVNMREMLPRFLTSAVETANRIVKVRLYLNPTMTGTLNWGYVDSSLSGVEVASPTNITPTGGRLVAALIAASGAPTQLNLHDLDLRLSPGDVLAISLTTVSNTTSAAVSLNWEEK